MKNLKISKRLCALLLGGTIAVSSLSGCGVSSSNQNSKAVQYEVVLEDLANGENQYALDYVNSLGFTSEEFRLSFYNYLVEGNGNCFINANQLDVVAIELSNVDDLTDLRLFPNLKKVVISDSNITNFEDLEKLGNLEVLEFNNTTVDCSKISNIKTKSLVFKNVTVTNQENLESIENVENLSVSYSHFINVDFIKNWKNLKSLSLINADITDFSCLADLGLTDLTIGFCQVPSWDFLSTLSNLSNLDISYTNFSDFSYIANLKKLESLNLAYTLIDNINGISNLSKLKALSLDSCQNLENYDEVSELKNLETFDCTNLEMQTDTKSLSEILENCDNVLMCDINIKVAVEKLYNSLEIKDTMSDEEKVKIIVEAVVNMIEYNSSSTIDETVYYNCHELKSAIEGRGMCSSFTGITCALLDLAGIKNYSIVGENLEDNEQYLHRWVVVEINGKLVGLDPTFIDDLASQNKISDISEVPYFLEDLTTDQWEEFHYPYFMPDNYDTKDLQFAR